MIQNAVWICYKRKASYWDSICLLLCLARSHCYTTSKMIVDILFVRNIFQVLSFITTANIQIADSILN